MVKRITENILLIIVLMSISITIYFFHYLIFGDIRQTLSGIILSLAYVPIGIIYQELIVDKILDKKQKLNYVEKINVVIGAFYNEVGNYLIKILSKGDENINTIKSNIDINNNWSNEEFECLIDLLKVYVCKLDITKIDIERIVKLLNRKDTLIINLMINESVKEYKGFIELLMSLIHLRDELKFIDNIKSQKLEEEMCKSYKILLLQWVKYIEVLKEIDYDLFLKIIINSPFNTN